MSERRALARVNLAAIERNCARLRGELSPGCELCVVVKADGYGHGAAPSARAALRGGATRLAVAGSREALALREAGLRGVGLLVMGALTEVELREALAADADVVVWHERHVQAVRRAGGGRVHVKLDTGMGRLGTRDPEQALRVAQAALEAPEVTLAGVMTHFATADDRTDSFFAEQLRRFEPLVRRLKVLAPDAVAHAANSAATLREPGAHFDMVRCGIAAYGMDPFGEDALARGLEPALELVSYVTEVKRCAPGESAGYGRRFIATRPALLGVLPIGYGDGWRRGLSDNAEVLIGGVRRAIVGTISMDNLTVQLEDDEGLYGGSAGGVEGVEPAAATEPGAEAILIGRSEDGRERISAEELAARLGTINYEITCGLTARAERVYHRDGEPVEEVDGRPEEPSEASAGRA